MSFYKTFSCSGCMSAGSELPILKDNAGFEGDIRWVQAEQSVRRNTTEDM